MERVDVNKYNRELYQRNRDLCQNFRYTLPAKFPGQCPVSNLEVLSLDKAVFNICSKKLVFKYE
jgi:hypothetical protein